MISKQSSSTIGLVAIIIAAIWWTTTQTASCLREERRRHHEWPHFCHLEALYIYLSLLNWPTTSKPREICQISPTTSPQINAMEQNTCISRKQVNFIGNARLQHNQNFPTGMSCIICETGLWNINKN